MATHSSDCTREGCHYAASGSASGWTSSSKFYSGKDGTWYRSRVTFKTGSFVGVSQSSKRFVMQLTIDSTASPCGCMATLTTKSLVPGKIMNDNVNGPHADLTADCIGQSYAYADSAATTESTGTNKSSGYTFYFSFSSSSIQPNTTYYVYCHYKSGRGSSTGWTRCNASALSAWVEYTPNWRLTCNTSTGVSSFTGGGDYAHNTTASATATASTGYHLTKYNGTNVSGGTQDWTISGSPTSDTDTWTMTLSRTITAYAAVNSHTLTINPNGGTWGGKTSNSTFTKNYASTTDIEDPTRSGYRFAGWTWSSDLGFTLQDPALGFPIARSSSSRVAYAVPDNYSRYTFTSQNSSSSAWDYARIAGYSVSANETVTITGQVRIASNSAGLAANFYHGATTNDYQNCKLSISSTYQNTWQDFSFTRTFTAAGTSYLELYTSDQKGKSGTMVVDLRCIKISRSKNGVVPTSVTMPNGWVTLIAQWVPVYTITCQSPSEGTLTFTKTQDTPLLLPETYKSNTETTYKVRLYYNDGSTGYIDTYATWYPDWIFDGWYESGVGYVSYNGGYYFTANRSATLTAMFVDDGYTTSIPLYEYIPDRVGYTFNGWWSDSSGSQDYYENTDFIPDGDMSLYIKWTINTHTFCLMDYYSEECSNHNYGSNIVLPAISDTTYEEYWATLPMEYYHWINDSDELVDSLEADVWNVFSPIGSYEVTYYDEREDSYVTQYLKPGDTFIMPDYSVDCRALYISSQFNLGFWTSTWNYSEDEGPQYDNSGNHLRYQKFKHWALSNRYDFLPKTLPTNSCVTVQLTSDQVDMLDFSMPLVYYSVFSPASAVLAYHKASDNYKLGLPLVKDTNYQNASAFWIKAEDRWMTLQEYKDTQE